MTPPRARIHIVGASGSGTTTLGEALAHRIGGAHLDTDAYFWMATDPPFTTRRPVEERLQLLGVDLDRHVSWMLTGSLIGWGDVLIPRFDLVVFLYVPPDVRMARIVERERQRYGSAIDPGGPMHAASKEFIAWAASYDDPAFAGRSLARHRAWIEGLPCPVVEIAGTPTVEESVARVLGEWKRAAATTR